jgi:hypothetical protein
MGNGREVDALAMTAFLEDERGEIIPSKPQSQSFEEICKRFSESVYRDKTGSSKSSPSEQLNGSKETTPPKAPVKPGLDQWIKDNPIESLLIGALIVGGGYMLYKQLTEKKKDEPEKKEANSSGLAGKKIKLMIKRKKEEQTESGNDEIQTHSNIKKGENEQIKAEKEKSISRNDLGIGIAAALGGSIVGAAFGDSSLLASIPVLIAGICKSSLGITMTGAGMALAGGYKGKEVENESGFLQGIIQRIINYLSSLFKKLFPFQKKEQNAPEGAINTMLGYFFPSNLKQKEAI